MSDIQGVIFDLDGTLYRLSWHLRALIALMVLPRILRMSRFIAAHASFAGKDFGSRERLLDEISRTVGVRENRTRAEIRLWIDRTFYRAFVTSIRLLRRRRRPGLRPTLEALRNAGIRTAVLSDYGYARERLQALGAPAFLFSNVASAEEYGALKPSPRPFLSLAQEWGIAPERILVIGDRTDTDGAGAARAGMQFLHLCDAPGRAASWFETQALLRQLCRDRAHPCAAA